MIDSLAATITLLALVAAIVLAVAGARRRYSWTRTRPVLWGFEIAAAAQALLAAIGLLTGHDAREPATLIAYLGVSVATIPVAVSLANGDDGVWAALLVSCALLVLAVVTVRAQTTWRTA